MSSSGPNSSPVAVPRADHSWWRPGPFEWEPPASPRPHVGHSSAGVPWTRRCSELHAEALGHDGQHAESDHPEHTCAATFLLVLTVRALLSLLRVLIVLAGRLAVGLWLGGLRLARCLLGLGLPIRTELEWLTKLEEDEGDELLENGGLPR